MHEPEFVVRDSVDVRPIQGPGRVRKDETFGTPPEFAAAQRLKVLSGPAPQREWNLTEWDRHSSSPCTKPNPGAGYAQAARPSSITRHN